VKLSNADWIVTAALPFSEATRSLRQSRQFSLVLLVMAIILTGAAFLVGRAVTRALDIAKRSAIDLGRGDAVTVVKTPIAEVNEVMEAMGEASRELRNRYDRAQVLLGEVAHRAKNQLAVVKSIAVQTGRHSSDVPRFLEAFGKRVDGMARSHNVLMRGDWVGADIAELVKAHVSLVAPADRVAVRGTLSLGTHAAQNVGFALHELATNSAKFGALSRRDGAPVTVTASLKDDIVSIVWREAYEQPPEGAQRGFGTRVLSQLVPGALEGRAVLHWSGQDLQYELTFLASHLAPSMDAAS
jgi:two-component sensor histidine kinase